MPYPVLKLVIAAAAAEILRCDVARQTAVDVHDGEHADEDAWLDGRPQATSARGASDRARIMPSSSEPLRGER